MKSCMQNIFKILTISLSVFVLGCAAKVIIDKRPNLAFPVVVDQQTNDWVIIDQGYVVKYSKWGLNTQIETISAELTTNKTVKFNLGGLHSTISTNTLHFKLEDIQKVIGLLRETQMTMEQTNGVVQTEITTD